MQGERGQGGRGRGACGHVLGARESVGAEERVVARVEHVVRDLLRSRLLIFISPTMTSALRSCGRVLAVRAALQIQVRADAVGEPSGFRWQGARAGGGTRMRERNWRESLCR